MTIELSLADLPVRPADLRAGGIEEVRDTAVSNPRTIGDVVDAALLLSPVPVLGEMFWEQLLHLRGASTDVESLEQWIRKLAAEIGLRPQ